VKGVATFSDLSLTEAGTYKLTITDGEMSAKTVKFTVSAAAAADLAFVQGPTPVKAGRSIKPAISVSLTDAFGNPITGTTVKLAIASGPAGAILSGTLKVAAENGLATFSGISLTESGGYTLKATHGSLTPATSGDFAVSHAAASQLAFVQQPTTAAAGASITPAILVDVEDSFGNLVATNDSNVTLVIKPGTGPAGAILDGTLTVAAQNGVAMFSDISLTDEGTYKLKATDGSLARARSTAFNILAAS
jgi:adhesin/invasin